MYHMITYDRAFAFLIMFTLLLSFALPGTAASEELHPDGLTAKDIIQRMAEAYAKSRSYSDSGVVKTVFISTDSRRTTEKPFTTAFIRPDRFRFEFREKKHGNREYRYIVYRDGKDVQTYWDVDNGIRKAESLDGAVARAAGVSSGSAHRIPAMLLPDEITWRRAIRFHDPKRIGDAVFDTADCFRIHDAIMGGPVTLWIDKKTFMLRKVYREQMFEDFRTQETTTYEPMVNGPIRDKMLAFDPPTEN